MIKDNRLPNRKTIRLRGYDYSQANSYFITVCTVNRECIFGQIQKCRDGISLPSYKIELNRLGEIVNNSWEEISRYFMNVETNEFIIMPNHIHGIIKINDPGDNVEGRGLPALQWGIKTNPI